LQLSFRHRSGPLELLAAYTWNKSFDDSSGWGHQINVINHQLGRALSSFDVPQNFVVSYHYDLPFDKVRRNRLTSGWVVTGITRFASGLPVTLRENDDNSLLGTNSTGPNGNGIDTPNYNGGTLHFHDPRSGQPYFDITSFSKEALGEVGTANKACFTGAESTTGIWHYSKTRILPRRSYCSYASSSSTYSITRNSKRVPEAFKIRHPDT
jgi:hypothetical protein